MSYDTKPFTWNRASAEHTSAGGPFSDCLSLRFRAFLSASAIDLKRGHGNHGILPSHSGRSWAAAAAVGTGIYAEPGVLLAPSVRGHLLEKHQDFMILTLCVSVVLAIWSIIARPFPKKGRALFMLLLFALLGVMSVGADYGARMVYDYNAGGRACPQPIEFVK